MYTALVVIDILTSLALVVLILIQHGKGADVGAAFGSGASQTVFGSGGSGSFLTRATAILALIFFVVSLSLAYLSGQRPKAQSVLDSAAPVQSAPQSPLSDSGLPRPSVPPVDVPASPPQNITVMPKDSPVAPVESARNPIDVPSPSK